jgi:hypothetical protein
VAEEHRQLKAKLVACCRPPDPQIKASIIDELASAVEYYTTRTGNMKRQRREALATARELKTACETVIAHSKKRGIKRRGIAPTEAEKLLAIAIDDIAYYQELLGEGDASRKAWHHPCRIFAHLLRKARQSADRAAGHKISTGFTAPMIALIRELLAPICTQNGEGTPTTRALQAVVVDRAD